MFDPNWVFLFLRSTNPEFLNNISELPDPKIILYSGSREFGIVALKLWISQFGVVFLKFWINQSGVLFFICFSGRLEMKLLTHLKIYPETFQILDIKYNKYIIIKLYDCVLCILCVCKMHGDGYGTICMHYNIHPYPHTNSPRLIFKLF